MSGGSGKRRHFLVTSLRDELAALADAGLANLLARGAVGGRLASVTRPPPLLPAQQDAYRACLGEGLWLVWSPPGTGKTRVLRAAVTDLIEAGKRVLLSSALTGCEQQAENGLRDLEDARRASDLAANTVAKDATSRHLWADIDSKTAELAEVEGAARQSEARALIAENTYNTAQEEIGALRRPDGKVRWRDRSAQREAQRRLDMARPEHERLSAAASHLRRR
jgi:hypothetical protein